jgi:hypothetical protein
MLLRSTLGAALILTIAACGQSLAAANQSGHLAALAARQDLCDLVCYAKADGTISQSERAIILQDAKSVLSPAEYLTFKQNLDRIAPPPPKKPATKHFAKTGAKKGKTKQLAKATPKKPAPVAAGSDLVIPASVTQPDGVAPPTFLR